MSVLRRQRGRTDSRRLTWPEMAEYWRAHDVRWGRIDYEIDPEGLSNGCTPGHPLWLGQYFARFQRVVYERLLDLTPTPPAGARALDVGCGAARWCVVLSSHGYEVTGIDIQPTLIADNRRRFPHMDFFEVPIQDFRSAKPFDLVSTVTVLQHIPFDEQVRVAARLRELVVTGGHAVVLENIRYQAHDHFARAIADWVSVFAEAGFRNLAVEPYNYSLTLRALGRLRSVLPAAAESNPSRDSASPLGSRRLSVARRIFPASHRAALRIAVGLDGRLEPMLMNRRPPLTPLHCGFLFQAV